MKLRHFRAMFTATVIVAAQGFAPVSTAQTAADIARLPVAEMCSTDGAIGVRFGDTALPPIILKMDRGIPRTPLPPRFAPFTKVAMDTSAWSNKFYSAVYGFETKPDTNTDFVIENIANAFAKSGWTRVDGADDQAWAASSLYAPPRGGEVVFFANPADAKLVSPQGTYAMITRSMGMVLLDCNNGALLREHAEEASGKLPKGTPKPLPPAIGFASADGVDTLPSCATPDGVAAAYTQFTSPGPGQLPAYFQALASLNYQDRLFQWKMSQIANSGKFSEDALFEFTLSLVDKSVEANMVQGFENVINMLEFADAAERAEVNGDKAAFCRNTVQLIHQAIALNTSAAAMWARQHRKIDAEATKLGIAL